MAEDGSSYVMRLVLRGMDPAEVERVASMSGRQIEDELKKVYARLGELHKKASQAKTKEEVASNNAQIKAEQAKGKAYEKVIEEQIKATKKLERETRIALNAGRTHWRRTLEDLENITVVTSGAIASIKGIGGAIVAIPSKMLQLAESANRVSKVYGSLQGNVDKAVEILGDVSKLDIIIERNRALEMGLELTDEQFTAVAASADAFADAVGVDTKDALEQLVTGLANGNEKLLKRAGIVVDVAKAEEDFAKKIGLTRDALNDEQKTAASREAALEQMQKKMVETAGGAKTLAEGILSFGRAVGDMFNDILSGIGNIRISDAKDPLYAQAELAVAGEFEKMLAESPSLRGSREAIMASMVAKKMRELQADRDRAMRAQKDRDYAAEQAAMEDSAFFGSGDGLPGTIGSYRGEKFEQALTNARRRAARAGRGGSSWTSNKLITMPWEIPTGAPSLDAPEEGEREHLFAQSLGYTGIAGMKASQEQEEKARKQFEEMSAKVKAEIEKLQNEVLSSYGLEGGGLFEQILFGPGGVEKMALQMDVGVQAALAAAGQLKQVSVMMTTALGESLYAALAGNEDVSFKKRTKLILDAIGKEAAVQALFEGAKALATFGTPAAAKHAGAAAGFAATAVAAGVASRAIGASISGETSASPSSTAAVRSGGEFGASRSSARGSSSDGGAITLVFNGPVAGDPADLGRVVREALDADRRKRGLN